MEVTVSLRSADDQLLDKQVVRLEWIEQNEARLTPSPDPASLELSKLDPPKVEPPKSDLARLGAPEVELPKLEPPTLELSQLDLSKVGSSEPDQPNISASKADLAKLEPPELPMFNLPNRDPPEADLSKPDLARLDPLQGDLSKSDLSKSDLSKPDLSELDPPSTLEISKLDPPNVDPPKAVPPRPAQAAQSLNPDEIATLVKVAKDFLRRGDIASARVSLKRAALAGNAQAALELGMTFDQAFLAEWGVLGFTADATQAREWYEKASKLGSTEALQHLAR